LQIVVESKQFSIFNSAGNYGNDVLQAVLPTILSTLALPGAEAFSDIQIQIPQQDNGYDCGVFVVVCLLYSVLNLAIPAKLNSHLWRTTFRLALSSENTNILPSVAARELDTAPGSSQKYHETRKALAQRRHLANEVRRINGIMQSLEAHAVEVESLAGQLQGATQALRYAADQDNEVAKSLENVALASRSQGARFGNAVPPLILQSLEANDRLAREARAAASKTGTDFEKYGIAKGRAAASLQRVHKQIIDLIQKARKDEADLRDKLQTLEKELSSLLVEMTNDAATLVPV
jgi:hypothetical protein